jgi:hypothetical protein
MCITKVIKCHHINLKFDVLSNALCDGHTVGSCFAMIHFYDPVKSEQALPTCPHSSKNIWVPSFWTWRTLGCWGWGPTGTLLKEQGCYNPVQNRGHKGPVLRPRCIGPGEGPYPNYCSSNSNSQLVVCHCRNSSVLSLLSVLLALFWCACVSSFSILVQFY